VAGPDGKPLLDEARDLPDHGAALQAVLDWLGSPSAAALGIGAPRAVGHRVVHGGAEYRAPVVLTPEVVAHVEALVPLAPDHLPQALGAIRAAGRVFPDLPQVACFDTAFHRDLPRVAQQYALPRDLGEGGVRRYGFHGLSYEYVLGRLGQLDPPVAAGRVILAHLGNGASMAAVRGGVSVETTMGFTPTGGLVMGTRPGDLDPGVLLYLLQERHVAPDALNHLLNAESGLLGLSETSEDMHDLLEREGTDPRAAEAVDLFCYQARKTVGALAAVLGGLDALVFTGGIGEHAAPVRERICRGLELLGVAVDPRRNAAHAPLISPLGNPVAVRIIPTDEERMIARHTARLLFPGRSGP
jgi:acetate kinase